MGGGIFLCFAGLSSPLWCWSRVLRRDAATEQMHAPPGSKSWAGKVHYLLATVNGKSVSSQGNGEGVQAGRWTRVQPARSVIAGLPSKSGFGNGDRLAKCPEQPAHPYRHGASQTPRAQGRSKVDVAAGWSEFPCRASKTSPGRRRRPCADLPADSHRRKPWLESFSRPAPGVKYPRCVYHHGRSERWRILPGSGRPGR